MHVQTNSEPLEGRDLIKIKTVAAFHEGQSHHEIKIAINNFLWNVAVFTINDLYLHIIIIIINIFF